MINRTGTLIVRNKNILSQRNENIDKSGVSFIIEIKIIRDESDKEKWKVLAIELFKLNNNFRELNVIKINGINMKAVIPKFSSIELLSTEI